MTREPVTKGMTKHTRSYVAASAALLAVFAPIFLVGCSAQGRVQEPGRRSIVFLDLSASVDYEQRRLWGRDAARVVDALAGGCGVAVLPIHDHTLEAAPLFEGEVPQWLSDATFDVASRQKAALVQTRDGASAAIRKALDGDGGAIRTDIFSAIDRIRPDPNARRTAIYFFSDMLNSTSDLNMERPGSLTRSNAAEQIQNLARRHAWRPGILAGVEVYCVLNSIESGHSGPAVDRLTQRYFYEALFKALGARLVTYDTHLGSLTIGLQQGASHDPAF
jgi:hypothetical protein